MSRHQVVGSSVLAMLLAAGGFSARGQVIVPPPTPVANLLTSYVDWVQGRRKGVELIAIDLDVARRDLTRIAPLFLVPVEGPVEALRGTCPTLSFTVAGNPIVTGATTEFDSNACGLIGNFSTVRVLRQPESSLPVTAVVLLLPAPTQPQPGIQSAVTSPAKPDTLDESRRRLLTAFALELAAAGSSKHAAAAARLVEWACPYIRSHSPVNDFDRSWQLAALSVLEGGIDSAALHNHLDHARWAFSDEPRLLLARGIVEEQFSAPAEELDAPDGGSVSFIRARELATRAEGERHRAADRAIVRFQEALKDESIQGEARLRLGHVQLGLQKYDEALASWAEVEHLTSDPALIYLVRLFRGLAFEGLRRVAEAKASYLQALEVSPRAHSATMRLAALVFRHGRSNEVEGRIEALLADDDPRRDPWWSYYAADWRFWYPRIERVRGLLNTP